MKVLVKGFIKKESSSGIILIFVTILALILRNSFLADFYSDILHTKIVFSIGELIINKPLYLWINDGFMSLFFLVIGLEIKRELKVGHLSSWSKIALPAIAAVGGMLVPALIFLYFNHNDSVAIKGWAIPTATDIAFALGILSFLGKRVPTSLKIFLMALAIFDDIGAIVIIALFYTSDLSTISILAALSCIFVLFILNKLKVTNISFYMLVGIILWVSVLKTGVHATLAGIILAFFIPLDLKNHKGKHFSPANKIRHLIHFWVAFLILPLFAFANAGIDLSKIDMASLNNSVSLGIFLGLFIGKQVGVFAFVFIAVKLKLAKLPKCTSWLQIYGISILTGMGFTMSLFIDALAYSDDSLYLYTDKLAILVGSFLSGFVAYLILLKAKSKKFCKV